LDLPVEEYGQPFPALMIKLPPDYAQARVSRIENHGLVPEAVVLRHDPNHKVALASVRFRGGNDAGYHLALDRPGRTIEQVWEEFRDELNAHAASPQRDLAGLAQSLVRLGVSACLMLMVYGAKRVGPD